MADAADAPTLLPAAAPVAQLDLRDRIRAWTEHVGSGDAPPPQVDLPVAISSDVRGFDRAKSGNTAILLQRLSADGTLEPSSGDPDAPYGWFHGWRIIGAEAKIDGGVYLGRKPREAIVVDMRRPGSLLRKVYERWLEQLCQTVGADAARHDLRRNLTTRVSELVEAHMPYDEQVVKRLDKQGFLRPDEPIDLDVFLAAKGGVCRHQVCFVGAMLERLADNGWLDGRVSLERKFVSGWFSHAWVRLKWQDGTVVVLDPAQRRYVALRDLDAGSRMLYGRSEDQ